MPGLTRQGVDYAGGQIIAGSENVLTNNLQSARIGDPVQGHGIGIHGGPVMATGSHNVFFNNIPVCKAGDTATCGHPSNGSSNVFVNG